MHCTLLIPDLLPPREFGTELPARLRLPSFEKLLARGRTKTGPPFATEEWLCDRFGLDRQQDHPVAPLLLQADGGDPGTHYWLCADPVQLRVDRSRLIVTAGSADFSAAETQDLIDALNRHFAPDDIKFFAPTPARWYVRTQNIPRLVTTPLARALDRNVEHHLPRGDDALAWHRVMNEAQMILHTHPVITARDERGVAGTNSIWLWGGGTMPAIPQPPYATIWGGTQLMRALAVGAGSASNELPATGTEWVAAASGARHLTLIDTAAQALRAGNGAQWHERLAAIDALWIRPLINAVRTQHLSALTLVACNNDNLLESTFSRADSWRLWRRALPLAAYTADTGGH